MSLRVHAFGPPGGAPVVALHGVTSHGRHFRRLAREHLPERRVLAPDLLGHGDSPWEPPWDLDSHVEALLASLPEEEADWIGHSFGGRLAFEVAARWPGRVRRLVLIDPAILLAPHVGLFTAENARLDRSYDSVAEAIERRFDESRLLGGASPELRTVLEEELEPHLVTAEDGRFRYRYAQSAVVAAYGERCRTPPPFDAVRAPTLLVRGRHTYVPYDHLVDEHRAAAGDLLTDVVVEGCHTLLWDAYDETAAALARFLAQ